MKITANIVYAIIAGIVRNLKQKCKNKHRAEFENSTFKSRNYAYTFSLAASLGRQCTNELTCKNEL